MHKDTSALLKTTEGKRYRLKLIRQAKKKYKKIYPIGTFNNSFTVFNGYLILWFNTKDKSTHIVKCKY